MGEVIRTRDCIVHYKGDAYTVAVTQEMRTKGWSGGQGVQWADSPNDEFLVTYSSGLYGGFLLWGSDETSDVLTSMTRSQSLYGYAVLCAGGWLMSTSTFERYTYASRQSGPLVPLTYIPGDRVLFSLRGLWTTEDEWTASSDPRGPNGYFIGSVVQAPSTFNNHYLVLQTAI